MILNIIASGKLMETARRLINKLRGIDDLAVFYDIKTSTLSSLQPKIRIFKVNHADFDKHAVVPQLILAL